MHILQNNLAPAEHTASVEGDLSILLDDRDIAHIDDPCDWHEVQYYVNESGLASGLAAVDRRLRGIEFEFEVLKLRGREVTLGVLSARVAA